MSDEVNWSDLFGFIFLFPAFFSSHKTNICSLYKIFKIQEIKITLLST